MAFVLELQFSFSQPYLRNYLAGIVREFDIPATVVQKEGKILCAFASEHPALAECLDAVARRLPASCFLSGSRHYGIEGDPEVLPEVAAEYPVSLGVCAECQKEMLDPASRRYYYPFTCCAHCGGQYAFFEAYPFTRENTSLRYVRPCAACESETRERGRFEGHRLASCHDCGIPVRLCSGGSERYANDPGSFRTLFEVAAKALRDGKRLKVKTTMGWRRFFALEAFAPDRALLLCDPGKITELFSMTTDEFGVLAGIERPLLHVAVKDGPLRDRVGRSCDVKYPDDGFTVLLAKELQRLGIAVVAYEAADEAAEAEMVMEHDIALEPQRELRLFVQREVRRVAEGERVCFPARLSPARPVLAAAHGLAGIPDAGTMLFDRPEHFDSVAVEQAVVLEGETHAWHSRRKSVMQDEASFMSVIAEHGLFGKRCVGAHFEEEPSFLYYDGRKVIRLVPPRAFEPASLLERIASLRDGSDRLVENLRSKLPQTWEKLRALEGRQTATLFEAAAVILGLEDESVRGVEREALRFIGKGGLQVDTHVRDNRFDHAAFLASLISYRLAGVDSVLVAYSLFESFGDYCSDILQQIRAKTQAEHFILSGSRFAQASLFARMQRNLKMTPPKMNVNFPVGRENAVVGAVYL